MSARRPSQPELTAHGTPTSLVNNSTLSPTQLPNTHQHTETVHPLHNSYHKPNSTVELLLLAHNIAVSSCL